MFMQIFNVKSFHQYFTIYTYLVVVLLISIFAKTYLIYNQSAANLQNGMEARFIGKVKASCHSLMRSGRAGGVA